MTNDERPLVTFALLAYNQEKYIREAVEGAFSQTYEPLEIILSDDRSTDRTFEIMQEMAAAYKGPHKVQIRRSDQNHGLIGHMNAVASVASSDFLVVAAGDDVSFACRTAIIMKAFLADSKTMAVFSHVTDIHCDVVPSERNITFTQLSLLEMALNAGGVGKGATYAYRRECFFWPSPLPTDILSEDRILPFRAGIMGHVYSCDKKLLKYRIVPSSLTNMLVSRNKLAPNLRSHWLMLSALLDFAEKEGKIGFVALLSLKYVIFVAELRKRIFNNVKKEMYNIFYPLQSVLHFPIRIAKKIVRIRRSVLKQ